MKKKSLLLGGTILLMFSSMTVFGKEPIEPTVDNGSYMFENNQDTSDINIDDVFGEKVIVEDTIDMDVDDINENGNNTDNNADLDKVDIDDSGEEEVKHMGWYFNEQHNGWYYYNQQGDKLFGWQYIAGKWYYLDPKNQEYPGLMLSDCKASIGGATYFFNKNGAMLSGLVRRPEGLYYTNKNGEMVTGWQQSYEIWYYLDADNEEYPGLMLVDCEKDVEGATYFFDKSGAMSVGWTQCPEGWYYTDANGRKEFGWQQVAGRWYYLDAGNEEYPGLMLVDCEKDVEGATYFFDKSGAMSVGWTQCPEGWYYTDANGRKEFGWQQVAGRWYYLDAGNEEYPGLMLVNCERGVEGTTYFFDKSGAMSVGWTQRPEGWYYTDANGCKEFGWQQVAGRWYYLDAGNEEYPGLMLSDGEKDVEGATYFFEKSGAMSVGWILYPEGWYYTDINGVKEFGWQQIAGRWYYLDAGNEEYPGLMLSGGEKDVEGATYFFEESGAMSVGWVLYPEGWYYTNINGVKAFGWQQVAGSWYYLDADNQDYPGLMISNCERVIGDKIYYFTSSGAMRVGWYAESGSWYYYDDYTGQIVSGWRQVGNAWYYMDPENYNKMFSNGWKKLDGQWYLFNASGVMQTDWALVGGLWYYFGADGAARTGWKVIDGNWYYFYTANDPHGGVECAMARNVTIDGWRLTDSGAMVSSTEMKMLAKAQVYTSNTRYLIMVDRAACKVGIYTGKAGAWNQSKFWSCSPGKPSTPTVSGTFTVQGKGYYFDSGNARCFYYTQFKGNYLFHSVLYAQTSTPSRIIDGRLGMQLSHGCVRLDVNNAKWIYDNIPRGTKVVIY